LFALHYLDVTVMQNIDLGLRLLSGLIIFW